MDLAAYIRFALALVLVLGLILLIAWAARRFGLSQRLAPGSAIPRKFRRLSVVEVCQLDGRRRLVLVRRDEIEHLLVLSANGSGFVVERGIGEARRPASFKAALAEQEDELDADRTEDEAPAPRLGPLGPEIKR
jgi:flagellar protein FliO/FliZ